MRFEWDENKRISNLDKHGLDFADAEIVFSDPNAFSGPDDRYNDDRWQLVGKLIDTIIVLVAYIEPDSETIRVISMRKTTSREKERYLQELAHHANDSMVHLLEKLEKERRFKEESEKLKYENE